MEIKCNATLKGHSGPVYDISFEPSGLYILSGGDKVISLFNAQTGEFITFFEGHGWEVLCIDVAPHGNSFTSAGGDRALFIWDVHERKIVRRLSGHSQKINSVCYGGLEGGLIASASDDRTVRLWDPKSSSRFPVGILEEARDSVSSITIKDEFILSGSVDGFSRIYDVRKGLIEAFEVGFPITCNSLTRDTLAFQTATLDSTVRLFDRETGCLLNSYTGHAHQKYPIKTTFLDNDSLILGGSEDGSILIWDLVSGNCLFKNSSHSMPVSSVKPHPKLNSSRSLSFATASFDGTIKLWSKM